MLNSDAKDTLVNDLKAYFDKGSNNEYPSVILGLLDFQKAILDYSVNLEDGFGNGMVNFTAIPFVTAMGTLTNMSPASLGATQLATGLALSFVGITLDTTGLPPDGASGVSNVISTPLQASDVQSDFESILNLDFKALALSNPPGVSPKDHLNLEMAKKHADAIEKGFKKNKTTLTYVSNIFPFPTLTVPDAPVV